MIRILRSGALAFALLGAGFSTPTAVAASSATAVKEEYKPDQVIIVRESGKPDRRCVIVSAKKQSDGSVIYRVKALDNGETMTIHDRFAPPPVSKPQPRDLPTQSSTMNGVKLPADVANKRDPEPHKAPLAASKPAPEKRQNGLIARLDRLFGPSCQTCPPQQVATSGSKTAPGKLAKSTAEPPAGRMPSEPMPITYGPHAGSPPRPALNEPAPLPIQQLPADPVKPAAASETQQSDVWMESLKTALRPSERMAAVEKLCAPTQITDPNIRAAVMLAAQDDPAGVVRAACILGMSRCGLRDQAFMTLLVACQNDRDKTVRDEAVYALQKVTKR